MTPTLDKLSYLVVEDDEPKLSAITNAIIEIDPQAEIITCGSVASAVNIISKRSFDFAVLDMSLPAFDISTDLGDAGKPQAFGGQDILRFLEDTNTCPKSVIITQYEAFAGDSFLADSRDLPTISQQMAEEFPNTLIGVIYYSGRRGPWREQLRSIILKIKEDKIEK